MPDVPAVPRWSPIRRPERAVHAPRLLAAILLGAVLAAAAGPPAAGATEPATTGAAGTSGAAGAAGASATASTSVAAATEPVTTTGAAAQAPADAKAAQGKDKSKKSKAAAAKPKTPVKPPPAPPKPPVPNEALAQLKPLAGSWTCTGHTFGPGPEHPTTATMTVAWHLDGFWLEVLYEEAKAADNPVPLSSISEWGFDLLQKTLTSATVDNWSGIDTQTTTGWQGDKLVFEGSARRFGTQFQDRDTFVRHGDAQLVHTLEASVNDSWIKLHEDTCNRVPAK
ncbi:MAG: hypothetical protein JOZ15_05535 [Acidobacteria bacterium]|nr:hypothetical protein [Acidobacteriota bacterium]